MNFVDDPANVSREKTILEKYVRKSKADFHEKLVVYVRSWNVQDWKEKVSICSVFFFYRKYIQCFFSIKIVFYWKA